MKSYILANVSFFRRILLAPFLRQVSLKLIFKLIRHGKKPFYSIRDLILCADFLLSFFIRMILILFFLRIFRWHSSLNPYDIILLVLFVLSLMVLQWEKEMKAVAFLKPFRIDDINVGSAKLLKGKILLGHVFIQRTPDEWDQKRIATVLQRVEQATQWIEGQAQNYKMEVVFDNFLVQEPFLRFLNAIPCHKNRFRSWNAFEAILADAAEEVVARAKENHIENLMLMAHVNEAVRSYAVPKRLGDGRPINFIEYCVCSTFYSAASYAHEILHLFGADDFYIEFYTKLGDYRKEFLQGSIMLSAKSLEGVRIDDLTAQNIGWL